MNTGSNPRPLENAREVTDDERRVLDLKRWVVDFDPVVADLKRRVVKIERWVVEIARQVTRILASRSHYSRGSGFYWREVVGASAQMKWALPSRRTVGACVGDATGLQ